MTNAGVWPKKCGGRRHGRRAAIQACNTYSAGLDIHRRRTASFGCDVEGDPLTFGEAAHARLLDRADMHEDVLLAVLRNDKSIALGGVEPLHGARCQSRILHSWQISNRAASRETLRNNHGFDSVAWRRARW